MKSRDQSKNHGMNDGMMKISKKICLSIMLVTIFLLYSSSALHVRADNEDETSDDAIYYIGNVTGKVNVRVGPGENNERLVHNGDYVQMKPGDSVLILDEAMVGTKPWYYIEFEIGGETLRGYSTSSYIAKSDIEVQPSKAPEPTPTPEPTSTPAPTSTPEPTISSMPLEDDKDVSSSPKDYIFPIIVLIVAGGICAAVLVARKLHLTSENNEMTNAVKKLKNVNINEKNASATKSKSKKNPEIKSSNQKTNHYKEKSVTPSGVYLKDEENDEESDEIDDNIEELNGEKVKKNSVKEMDEKKRLRKEIDSLIEHDLIEHKYFGKGEVFDNSDVKLIEVRFGNDVRFLNKDSLVAKKLLVKIAGGNTRWNN